MNARWLDIEGAAAYLRLRPDIFLRRVKDGDLPSPSQALGPRTPRWDRERLDAVMAGKAPSADHKEIVSAAVQSILAAGRSRRKAQAARRVG
jgi:predicted DNA-binding transcriptional regulator AlpA